MCPSAGERAEAGSLSSFSRLATDPRLRPSQEGGRLRGTQLFSKEDAVAAIREWILERGRPPSWPEWERAKGRPSAKTIQRRWGWHTLVGGVVAGPDLHRRPSAYWGGHQRPLLRAYPDGAIIDALRAAHDELGRWPYATEWEQATPEHPSRRTVVRRFGSWSAAVTAARTAKQSSPAPVRKPPTPSVQEVRWTQGAVVDAMTAWHRERGRWPTSHDWRHAGPWWPSFGTVLARFERWAAAIAAAAQEWSDAERAWDAGSLAGKRGPAG